MRKLLMVSVFAFVSFPAFSQEAAKVTYADVIKTCGAEWRESDAKKSTPKGEGMAAWNTFRVECVARKGYVTKNAAKSAGFNRVPDAQKAN